MGDHLFWRTRFHRHSNTFLGLRAIHEALQKGKQTIFYLRPAHADRTDKRGRG